MEIPNSKGFDDIQYFFGGSTMHKWGTIYVMPGDGNKMLFERGRGEDS